jgi:hypothetical protein
MLKYGSACAKMMKVNGEEKLIKVFDVLLPEGSYDPVQVVKATTTPLWLLNKEVDCYLRTRAMGAHACPAA